MKDFYRKECFYCGSQATSEDHIIPRCKGGSGAKDNLVPACHRCNSSKGPLTLEGYRTVRALKVSAKAAGIPPLKWTPAQLAYIAKSGLFNVTEYRFHGEK